MIIIKEGIREKIPSKLKWGNKYAIISDSKVAKLYGHAFKRFLKNNKIECELFQFPQGEANKNLKTVEKLASAMIKKGFDRKDCIIALGGGVTGDIAGFLASIYMRGIPHVQVPTTLLAMVDSSVGGKTGVDLKEGKNLLGTFNQPKAIFVDPTHLKTLPQKQIRNGLAEVIKYGVIKDKKLFEYLEKNIKNPDMNKIIAQSVKIKSQIVQKDEKEAGLRMILNYGHTYGHAIERMSKFKLLHGYAISIGMVLANKDAVKMGLLKKEDADRIKKLLTSYGLPIVTLHKPTTKDIQSDKKKSGSQINFVLPTTIGKVIIKKC
ncbi:3-dehydroquinate synthase [Patescibacteria group bacterium]|nr:3-dehydroquinate synthase [Patescibacteria group bacterium]